MTTPRRSALKLFAVAGAAVTASAGSTATASAGSVADVIMMIRHGEKPPDSGQPFGIDANGEQDSSSLTTRGWSRAGALAELFAPGVSGTIRKGLCVPDAIYATTPTDTKHHRMMQTVTPVAAKLGRSVNTDFGLNDTDAVAAALSRLSGATLVSWEHNEIPMIAAALDSVSPTPPSSWPDDRFDLVWVFTRTGPGWAFTQVPQLLLDGDSAVPIA
ncbi:MAG: histidine phosphatase family protein [Kutzneria sp.]|nr:histidine phosphatase family protein [Kutzneria sp.]MBV9847970.1 histidine phosphatase family protein [Kutzneria sp.]